MNRRKFLTKSLQGLAAIGAITYAGDSFLASPYIKNNKIAKKVFVLGIDGMDPALLRRFIARGEMPTFQRFIENNHFSPLGTTLPPQSPVAWSSFISGCNPGGHGIFDFIHRDPKTFVPYLSTTRSYGAEKSLRIGKWSLPLKGGKVELLRGGTPFWAYLETHGVPATLFKIPANFPVESGNTKVISGMSTPDLLGTYGTFSYFTDVQIPNADRFTGGRVIPVRPMDHVIQSDLEGPPNTLREGNPNTQIPFTVVRDPWESVVKIKIQNTELILKQGEWSEWIPLKFELMPMFSSVQGMVRIYMQQVHPHFRMYISPINIDPQNANLPISNPPQNIENLSKIVGRFYTQGFPEDTKALSNGIFSSEEFLKQSKYVFKERLKAFDYELNQFKEGLFFFYFSSIDQNSHMLLRNMDPAHPLYEPKANRETQEAVYYFYRSMDDVLKQTLAKMDGNSTLMLLSDHGFAPFTREFHLSTWLVENGYTVLTDPAMMHESQFYDFVDWSQTKAFAMGLNSIYINLYGREMNGSVFPSNAQDVKQEIIEKLKNVRDPENGKPVLANVYDSRDVYKGPYQKNAPDIILGYASGYRISDEAVLGQFPKGIVGNRIDKWSADHCMDPNVVPGVLLTTLEVKHPTPAIWDLAPTILKSFGLEIPGDMDGMCIYT